MIKAIESFEGRQRIGSTAERLATSYFRQRGWKYQNTGVEHEPSNHPNTPDFRVHSGTANVWVEVKATDAISRDSFERCLLLDAERPVYVLVQPHGATDGLFVIRVTDLKFTTNHWRSDATSPTAGSGKPWRKIDLKNCNRKLIVIESN